MRFFPRIVAARRIDPDRRASAVDFVNRVNWLFETWDLENMIQSFTEDAKVIHFKGEISGETAIRHFLTEVYPYLVPGVSRCGTGHIVDEEENGLVAVRYHNLLVRYAAPEDAPKMSDGELTESDDLPMIWMYSPMLDRLRETEDGWRIAERYIGGSTTNRRLTPKDIAAAAIRPFLPGA
ncbi:nuclear transport factor 2 family protein [Burkholderia sp. Bp9143]|nr:nuclear transport factor 2 family protein [Burkholderia sp. Bp9143]